MEETYVLTKIAWFEGIALYWRMYKTCFNTVKAVKFKDARCSSDRILNNGMNLAMTSFGSPGARMFLDRNSEDLLYHTRIRAFLFNQKARDIVSCSQGQQNLF